MVRRWYQTLDVGDDSIVYEDPNRALSKFWNEGKWHNFIAPHLPGQQRTSDEHELSGRGVFIEIGCNAGLFLKMARDAGFKRVIGVEGNGQIFKQAEQYKKSVNGDWTLIPARVGVNFNLDELPVADVVLLSNMHYYLPVGVFAKLVDQLRYRTRSVIIVAARAKRRQGNAVWHPASVRGYFKDYPDPLFIRNVDPEDDPSPRPTMYSMKYYGGLQSVNVDSIFDPWFEAAKKPGHKSYGLAPALLDFYEGIIGGRVMYYEDYDFYSYWRKRLPNKSEKWTKEFIERKAALGRSICAGQLEPIYFDSHMKLLDGLHRLVIAKVLGYKQVIARIL